MKQSLKILSVEDNTWDVELIKEALLKAKMRCEVRHVMNIPELLRALEKFSDKSLTNLKGRNALNLSHDFDSHSPVVLILERQKEEHLRITETTLEVQEKERNAIGRELHDNVNQILAGTMLLLSMIKHKPGEAAKLIETSINNLHDAINENRKLTHSLGVPDFESLSLVDQIGDLADTMLKRVSINVEINSLELQEKLLNDKQKLAIYRIAQEQCTNILKYAKATEVNIFLSTADNIFKMVIADNGEGMGLNKKTDGTGLRNIKGRLSIFNGTASINSAPGEGFVLTIGVPLN